MLIYHFKAFMTTAVVVAVMRKRHFVNDTLLSNKVLISVTAVHMLLSLMPALVPFDLKYRNTVLI